MSTPNTTDMNNHSIADRTCDHDLEIEDESFDHEFGCEQIYFYRCLICGNTHIEDPTIPEQVTFNDYEDYMI